MVGAGTFFAQAVATGFVGRAAHTDRAAASGMYLASYYLGGVAGSAALGPMFENYGWTDCVGAIAVVLALLLGSAFALKLPAPQPQSTNPETKG